MVRAKFQLVEIRDNYYNSSGKTLVFIPNYDSSIDEDIRFAKATPSGTFQMYCDNTSALAQFELGKHYYFDISLV
jgi:hypothetical protein